MRMRDRKIDFIIRLSNISPVDSDWFAVAPNNSLITARNIGPDEIYPEAHDRETVSRRRRGTGADSASAGTRS
jgi:hypothetical protein